MSSGTHPNPSLKQGGALLRGKAGAHSPSLFQGGGQGVGTFNPSIDQFPYIRQILVKKSRIQTGLAGPRQSYAFMKGQFDRGNS